MDKWTPADFLAKAQSLKLRIALWPQDDLRNGGPITATFVDGEEHKQRTFRHVIASLAQSSPDKALKVYNEERRAIEQVERLTDRGLTLRVLRDYGEHLRTDGGAGESWKYLRLAFDQLIAQPAYRVREAKDDAERQLVESRMKENPADPRCCIVTGAPIQQGVVDNFVDAAQHMMNDTYARQRIEQATADRATAADFEHSHERGKELLGATIKLHEAALSSRPKHRQANLEDLLRRFYRLQCPPSVRRDLREQQVGKEVSDMLVKLAGSPLKSATIKAARYSQHVCDAIWPDGLQTTNRDDLSADDLQRALDSLNSQACRAGLRRLPVPNYDAERDAMQAELAGARLHLQEREQEVSAQAGAIEDLAQVLRANVVAVRSDPPDGSPAGKTAKRDGKQRGRKKADYKTVQREKELVAEWKNAKAAGVVKKDFYRDRKAKLAMYGIKEWEDLDRLIERVAKREKASE